MHITPWMVWVAKMILGAPINTIVSGNYHASVRTVAKSTNVEYDSAVGFWADGSITLHLLKDGYVHFQEEKNNLIGIIKLIVYRMQ